MVMKTKRQTWQVFNESPLTVIETSTKEPLDNIYNILDSKLDFPFRISLSGSVLTINPSEIQSKRSDGNESSENSFKIATAPIQNIYKQFVLSELDFATGTKTGSLDPTIISPVMSPNNYIWMGLEASLSGTIGAVWGVQNASASSASFPVFTGGTALLLVLLQDDGSGGTWNFLNPSPEDILVFKGSGGGGGGGTDLVASYESATQYRVKSTSGRLVRANHKYFYLDDVAGIVKSFDPGSTGGVGTWFICLNTSGDGEEVTASHIVETQLNPSEISFPQHYAPLASCEVTATGMSISSFRSVSPREINTLQGDFVPSYLDNDSFTVNHTFGRKVKLLSSYFYSETNITKSFEKSASGTWYIAIDTNDIAGPGQLTADHIKFTVENPAGSSFDPDYVAIGEYYVESDLTTVNYTKFIPYTVASAGAVGTLGDFVPLPYNTDSFSIRPTNGRKVLLNNKYYFSNEEIIVDYDKSAQGTWYIHVDTSQSSGEIAQSNHTSYFVLNQTAPLIFNSNPYFITIGEYTVDASLNVDINSIKGYSIREHTSWINGIPNIWKKSDRSYLSINNKNLFHNFGQTPDIVTYKYWDNSAERFYNLFSSDIEIYRNDNVVVYNVPDNTNHPFITWDTGDYFIAEAIKYAYSLEGGFASPKTDFATDWYTSTPPSVINHPLATRPQNISLEFVDLTGATSIYYVEDGLQYVDKSSGGITESDVTFDWSSFSIIPINLSSTLKMKIHFNVSKLSAGAFEASKNERGTVSLTGDSSKVISPDIILTSTDTSFASLVNNAGNGTSVLVTEDIIVTSEQEITIDSVYFNMLPGKYIISSTNGLSSILKFSGDDYEIENLRIIGKEDITSGLKLNADGIVKNVLIKQDASGKTLTNAVEVTTGNIATVFGRSKVINGIITNKISDIDGNSEITIS